MNHADPKCRSQVYQAIRESKGHTGDGEDKRLAVRQSKKPNEPKKKHDDAAPKTPREAFMEMSLPDADEPLAEASEIGGTNDDIVLDETADFYRRVDDDLMRSND